ncbi:MAG: Druantia anti-phage system protein DruA [Dissulfuribacterales bacterium]
MTKKRIADDWFYYYKYSPVMVETFVETPRFYGTCYKAANWKCLGHTKGIGRLGISDNPRLPIKSIWVYPLVKNFRKQLCK